LDEEKEDRYVAPINDERRDEFDEYYEEYDDIEQSPSDGGMNQQNNPMPPIRRQHTQPSPVSWHSCH